MKRSISPIILLLLSIGLLTNAQTPTLWGMTSSGGINSNGCYYSGTNGVIFSCSITGDTAIVQHEFNCTDGTIPFGSLIQASNGIVYGMTCGGGEGPDTGVLFSFDIATGIETVRHYFAGRQDGANPCGKLFQANNGLLYGLTAQGGNYDRGTLFSFDITNDSEMVLHSFGGANDGKVPASVSLTQASNGLLYGTTQSGGTLSEDGLIFSYDIVTDSEVALQSLGRTVTYITGQVLGPSLVPINDSLLYGISEKGVSNSSGMIFSYNISDGSYTEVYDFAQSNDTISTIFSLLNIGNGFLYGTAYINNNDAGVIFNFNITTGVLTILHNFGNGNDGSTPYGALIKASNGLLYGMTSAGGIYGMGTIFSYDITTDSEMVVQSFNGVNGEIPFGSLIEITNYPTAIPIVSFASHLQVYPNPSTGQFIVQLPNSQSSYQVEVYNMLGQKIEQLTLTNAQNTFNLGNQPNGMYFVSLQTETGNVGAKVIVDR